jgi:hypothetical protein
MGLRRPLHIRLRPSVSCNSFDAHRPRRRPSSPLAIGSRVLAAASRFNRADDQAALKIGKQYATFRRYAVEGQQ